MIKITTRKIYEVEKTYNQIQSGRNDSTLRLQMKNFHNK